MTEQNAPEQGTISIHTENIFPIIKKWLYSEKEIFLRELISNSVDAIHKLQHVNLVEGLRLADEYAVDVMVDAEAGTLTVKDNGIGMTADEIRRYINQVAFSSAEEFIEKFKDIDDKNQIIGHFGLGFYSSFMVASRVEIKSLSYQEGAVGTHWSCDGTTNYELSEIDMPERGTEVILHFDKDEREFLETVKIREVLTRYCNFLPIPIRLGGDIVNDQNPLWTKTPGEVTDDEYVAFYRKLYPMADEPLFWIHLNIDFPFNLKGILYFPKLTTEFDLTRSYIKLFCNQVFVSDNCTELIPEFLTPLQGCLDAPDLPLNISRSYLQNEPQVRKIQEVISGRVAGKLLDLAKDDRADFAKVWETIHTFVKFGMMRDDKFNEKLKDNVIYALAGSDGWSTLPEYLERATDKHANKVYYTTNETAQATYLKLFKSQGLEALVLDAPIDSHFIQFLEMGNSELTFARVDADVTENLLEQDSSGSLVDGEEGKSRDQRIQELFEKELEKNEGISVRVESLKDPSVPAMVLFAEQSRRFQEMTRTFGQNDALSTGEHTLLINAASPVVRHALEFQTAGRAEDAALLVEQVYDLAMLNCQVFDRDRMERFLERSNQLLGRIEPEVKGQ
jgi:molecular chaperone HtpG